MRNNGEVPSRHRLALLGAFRPGGPVTRQELARRTGLSLATVSRLTRELVRRRVLVEVPLPPSPAGRPAQGLEVHPDRGSVLGISLLAPRARVVALDLSGRAFHEIEVPMSWNLGVEGILEPLRRALDGVRRRRTGPPLAGVGAAVPGQWDRERGVSLQYPRIPEWKSVPLRRLLEEWTGVPASIMGYAPALALAEYTQRSAPGRRPGGGPDNLLAVEVAENIALGVVANGRVLEGASGNAGELGHITINPEGPVCYCGSRGCLETLATCAAAVEAAEDLSRGVSSDGTRPATFETLVHRAREGDAFAERLLARVARLLGVGLAAAVNLFNPEVLVLGGRFFEAGEIVLGPLRTALHEYALPNSTRRLALEPSSLGPRAPALGAGFAAIVAAVRRL
ncbi:MAG: ROK family protein [Planctomycetota bacterium]